MTTERFDGIDLACFAWGAALTGGLLVWCWSHRDEAGLLVVIDAAFILGLYQLVAWGPWSYKRAIHHWCRHKREEGDRWRQRAAEAGIGDLDGESG